MACSMDPALRLNAVWAIKNLLYLADHATKQRVMGKMTYDLLYEYISVSDLTEFTFVV